MLRHHQKTHPERFLRKSWKPCPASEATGTGISASGFKDFLLKSELLQATKTGGGQAALLLRPGAAGDGSGGLDHSSGRW